MMKSTKIELLLLFNATVIFIFVINVQAQDISETTAEKLYGVLDTLNNLVVDEKSLDDEDLLLHFENYGRQVALVLSLKSEQNVLWLWNLSILSNSIGEFYKPTGRLVCKPEIAQKFPRIKKAIDMIKCQITEYIAEKPINFLSKKKNKTPAEPIGDICSQLDNLNTYIRKKFKKEIQNVPKSDDYNIQHYVPINLYLYHIEWNESAKHLKSDSRVVEWNNFEENLLSLYYEATADWIDQNQTYTNLKIYRSFVTEALKVSFYGHLYMHILLFQKHIGNEIGNTSCKETWDSLVFLFEGFMNFFNFDDDKTMKDLCTTLKNMDFSTMVYDNIKNINTFVSNELILFYQNNENYFILDTYVWNEISDEVMEEDVDLMFFARKNLVQLQNYVGNLYPIFKNVSLKSARSFFNSITREKKQTVVKKFFF